MLFLHSLIMVHLVPLTISVGAKKHEFIEIAQGEFVVEVKGAVLQCKKLNKRLNIHSSATTGRRPSWFGALFLGSLGE